MGCFGVDTADRGGLGGNHYRETGEPPQNGPWLQQAEAERNRNDASVWLDRAIERKEIEDKDVLFLATDVIEDQLDSLSLCIEGVKAAMSSSNKRERLHSGAHATLTVRPYGGTKPVGLPTECGRMQPN